MKVLIIEDEVLAAERLEEMVRKAIPGVEVLGILDSISAAVKWFTVNAPPDLAFFDIQLADGLSFEIFEQIKVSCPVVFTTAYDEYALKAFKVNSIDYLLKPIDEEELRASIEKFRDLHESKEQGSIPNSNINNVLKLLTKQYKSRFVVRVGERIRSIPVDEIQCFYSMEKATFLQTLDDRNYTLDHSLEQIEALIDPTLFFKVSRKYIVALEAIQEIISHSNSRLRVSLKNKSEEDIIVAREKVKDFKLWLER